MTLASADREDAIARALQKVQKGVSKKAAAREYRIPESTLRGRLKGAQPLWVAKKQEQKLSALQEKALTDWIVDEEGAGRAPTRNQVQRFAEMMLSHGSGTREPLGINWISRFINRNPHVKMNLSESKETERFIARG